MDLSKKMFNFLKNVSDSYHVFIDPELSNKIQAGNI